MKKNIFKTITILLIVAGAMACKKEKKEVFPQEVPFTEYSLAETSCQWSNFHYDDKAIVINSHAELENYVICTEGSFPEIDFAKHTLLLARVTSAYGVGKIENTLIKNSENEYTWKIIVYLGFTPVAAGWRISIILPKIPDKSVITLDVTQI